MVTNFQKPAKKESKKDLPSKASTSKKKSKDDEDGKKKKQKKKKDPNAPKRAMSGFMFFSKLEREVCVPFCHSFEFGLSCRSEYISSLLQTCLASV